MAILITEDGDVTERKPMNGTDFSLYELYEMLDCSVIEIVKLFDNRSLVIDEEGKIKNKPPNEKATGLVYLQAGAIVSGDIIVGHALLCKKGELR